MRSSTCCSDGRPKSLSVHLYNADFAPFNSISIDEEQRCYTLSCTDDSLRLVKWNYLQSETWLLFFEGDECQGRSRLIGSYEGDFYPDKRGLKTVKSVVLWKYGMYSTRGIIDACPLERAPQRSNASSIDENAVNGSDISMIDSNQ